MGWFWQRPVRCRSDWACSSLGLTWSCSIAQVRCCLGLHVCQAAFIHMGRGTSQPLNALLLCLLKECMHCRE